MHFGKQNGEVVGNQTFCYTYDISANADGSFKMVQTSYTTADAKSGKQTLEMKLTRTKDGLATFSQTQANGAAIETGFGSLQVLDAKVGDYMVLLWCRNNPGKYSYGSSLLKH